MSSRRVTIAIPIHNEEEVLPALLQRVFAVLDQTPGGPHELLLVDDGSRDGSLRILEDAAQRDPRLRVIVLSRNFGHQAAVSAAFDHATGDVMMVMDGDLQDAPEALPILLKRLDEGFDVVYVRRTRRKEPFWLRTSYHIAYRIISRMSKLALPVDAGDFALLSRRAVDAVRALPERQRYLRGLRSWVGFRQTGEVIERHARAAGESKYSAQRAHRPGARRDLRVLDGAAAIDRRARRIRPHVRGAVFAVCRVRPPGPRPVTARLHRAHRARDRHRRDDPDLALDHRRVRRPHLRRSEAPPDLSRRPDPRRRAPAGAARLMDPRYGAQYARLYREHWWWRAREEYLTRLLDRRDRSQ